MQGCESDASTTGKAPDRCTRCSGGAETFQIIGKFAHVDYGHVGCRRCGITFDDNVNDYLGLRPETADITRIEDETEYRKLFIETSRIARSDGVVYANFDWDDNEAVRKGVVRHVVEALARHAPLDSYSDILDLGCGNGFTTVELSEHMAGARMIAVDPSPEVLRIDGVNGIRAMQGTLDSLSFPDGAFDGLIIIGNLMLHYDPWHTLREAHRCLRVGAPLIIDFKNIDASMRKSLCRMSRLGLQRYVPRKVLERAFVNMRFGFRRDFVRTMAEEIGFEVTETYSKPPRLIEFRNRSAHQAGLKGILWRASNALDSARDQQAWVQMTLRKRA